MSLTLLIGGPADGTRAHIDPHLRTVEWSCIEGGLATYHVLELSEGINRTYRVAVAEGVWVIEALIKGYKNVG